MPENVCQCYFIQQIVVAVAYIYIVCPNLALCYHEIGLVE